MALPNASSVIIWRGGKIDYNVLFDDKTNEVRQDFIIMP